MELIVSLDGVEETLEIREDSAGRHLVTVGDRSYELDVVMSGGGVSMLVDGRQREFSVTERGNREFWVSGEHSYEVRVVDPLTKMLEESGLGGSGGDQLARAEMPGRVVSVLVAEGDEVEKGQGVVVIEAMKMENEIAADSAGVVETIFVEEGQAVDGGDDLFQITAQAD